MYIEHTYAAVISGDIPVIVLEHAFEAEIRGDILVNCYKLGKIQRFGLNRRKNSPYFKEKKGYYLFRRNFFVYFSNSLPSTFSYKAPAKKINSRPVDLLSTKLFINASTPIPKCCEPVHSNQNGLHS